MSGLLFDKKYARTSTIEQYLWCSSLWEGFSSGIHGLSSALFDTYIATRLQFEVRPLNDGVFATDSKSVMIAVRVLVIFHPMNELIFPNVYPQTLIPSWT